MHVGIKVKFEKSKILSAILKFLTPIRIVVICAVIFFFWFFVLGDKGIYQLRKLLDMKYRLVAERQSLSKDIDNLTEEKKLLSDPKNLEQVIRKELGYIKPGEVVFEEKTHQTTITNDQDTRLPAGRQ